MLRLFIIELYRTLVAQIRYPMDFVSGLIGVLLLFYGLLLGARHITGTETFNANLEGIFVSYAAWMILSTCMGFVPGTIQGEAQRGTLEMLFTSSMSIQSILLVRTFTQSLVSYLFTSLILGVLLWFTERSVKVTPEVALPLIATVGAATGVGFVVGGLALRFKQVGGFLGLLQYPLIFLLMTPFERMDAFLVSTASWLPVVPSAMTLRQLMVEGLPLADTYYLMSLVNGGIYLAAGMLIFSASTRAVMRKGLLAGY